MVLTELLAPAGSYDILVVAINAGANAVYIAGHRYGARAFAHNFTSEEIEKAVEYAHLNGATVHVTVNTLFNSSEILDVLKYIQFLYRTGVDAVIVQDIGLVYLINKFIPEMEVHSSTQMTLRDYNSLLWAKDEGIKRVILPREMEVDEIKKISTRLKEDNIDLDLEVFGHGSLCYCISGDCYMSSFISGRSANRGACAQPCRSDYKLKYKNHSISNGCLISTHDLATFKDVKAISDAGIISLKVEGRLKSEDYVTTVIKAYRTMIDNMNNDDNTELINKLQRELDLTFNRYYTNGYILNDSPGEVMGRESSFHQGLYLGKIISIEGEDVDIEFADKNHPILQNGDGIGFKHNNHIRGIYIDNIVEQDENHIHIRTTRDIRVGSEVYISYSKELHDRPKQYNKETVKPHIPISLDVSCNKKMKMTVNASFRIDNDTISFGYKSKNKLEKAINQPLDDKTIIEHMSKSGETPFIVNNVRVNNLPDNVFMPIGKINTIRREVLDKASEKLLEYYIPDVEKAEDIRKNIKNYDKKIKENKHGIKKAQYVGLNVYVDNLELLTIANRNPLNRIYFDPSFIYDNKKDYFNNIEDILRQATSIADDKEVVWVLSAFTSDEDLEKITKIYNNLRKDNINISIMGDSPSLTRTFPDTNVYGAHNLNIWNNYSVAMLNKNGFKGATISSELSQKEIKELVTKSKSYNTKLELIVQGNQEIMVSKDDFSNLNGGFDLDIETDEYVVLEDKQNKAKFQIYFDYNKQSHFFNNDLLCLIDEIDTIKEMGIENITLDCRFTKERYLSKVISLYIERLRENNPERKYSESINEISYSKLNKGNFENTRVLEDKKSRNRRKKGRS
ncbi:U32 family peptidase [Methanosphaera sp. WGK6]|uniref:U32 family peptidase n=1 Tax=Methanosphaera sp. WGK6 TaxID=1561964 RepID=UPI00084C798B|nr:U32 family peptidase [Methanosphaera sp. WGK6]OED29622.1 peptidase [Methanosphaera sp. WGK6]